MKSFIGIDPGVNGALCVIWADDTVEAFKCPQSVRKMADLFRATINNCIVENYEPVVGIERVWTQPRDGRVGAFTFGMNYGMWLGIMNSFNLNPIIIMPKEWQSMLKRYKIPKDYLDRKRKFKLIAQKYVDFKVTLATADAILITKYLKENYSDKKE